jgi:hypothetical protein
MREFPHAILRMSSLEILDVSKNKLKSIPPEIVNLTSLKVFALQKNRIEELPVCFADMGSLQILKLGGNPISFPPPEILTIQDNTLSPENKNKRDYAITLQVKKFIKQHVSRDKKRVELERLRTDQSGDESWSERNVKTSRPSKRANSGRFPVKPSISNVPNNNLAISMSGPATAVGYGDTGTIRSLANRPLSDISEHEGGSGVPDVVVESIPYEVPSRGKRNPTSAGNYDDTQLPISTDPFPLLSSGERRELKGAQNSASAVQELEVPHDRTPARLSQAASWKLNQFIGARAPSDIIKAEDLASYFPDSEKDEFDKTTHMSIRRSASPLALASHFTAASQEVESPLALTSNFSKAPREVVLPEVLPQIPPQDSVSRLKEPSHGPQNTDIGQSASTIPDNESPADMPISNLNGEPDNAQLVQSLPDILSDPVSPAESSDSTSFATTRSIKESSAQREIYGWKSGHQVYGPSDEEPLEVCDYLGHGALGTVEEVKLKGGDFPSFVRKRVQLHMPRRGENLKAIQQEVKVLESLSHPNIVDILGTYEVKKQNRKHFYCVLMSPIGDNDLRAFLDIAGEGDTKNLEWNTWILDWIGCLASALTYMHEQGIRHQDIKPSNIVHRGSRIFFTDFSSAGSFEVGRTTSTENPSCSSPMYSAPEVLERFDEASGLLKHGTGSDVFALGCVYCDMLSVLFGKPVSSFQDYLAGNSPSLGIAAGRSLFYSRKVDMIKEWLKESRLFANVVAPMLAADRASRPTAREVLGLAASMHVNSTPCGCMRIYVNS